MAKFNWKVKHCDDRSGEWLEANIKEISWDYCVDREFGKSTYCAFVYCGKEASDEIILKEGFKTQKAAQNYCERHFSKLVEKIKKNY